MPTIGFDFGNFNSFTCYISDFDGTTRIGGYVHSLFSGEDVKDGVPSVYFYEESIGELCGENAMRNRAKPFENRKRYLKRNMNKTFKVVNKDKSTKELSYNDAITAVIQHCIRKANEELLQRWRITTNLISLSYPASFTFRQRLQLIELAEKATLADGTHLKVSGTIKEPAAAALDYLSEFTGGEDTTVLVYDLGGGTFDVALVSAYPKGRKNNEGNTYYYDVLDTEGVPGLGGKEFDDELYNLVLRKLNVNLSKSDAQRFGMQVESYKKDLTDDTKVFVEVLHDGDMLEVEVTREEFEKAVQNLLNKTIDVTRRMLDKHPKQKPEMIILTGGASKMPMVKKELETKIPEYAGKVNIFRPLEAIARGAARFGTAESDTDPVVQQYVERDIGVRFFESQEDEVGHIATYIKAGTELPCKSDFLGSRTLFDNASASTFKVYEAKGENPDKNNVSGDYSYMIEVTLEHSPPAPAGKRSESRILIDKTGLLTIEARDPEKPGKPPIKSTYQINKSN